MESYRIVVMGDFQLKDDFLHLTEQAMEDVKKTKADLLVPLGDLGSQKIGSVEGLLEADYYFKLSGVPSRPLIGNHDLQREHRGHQEKGTIERAFCDIFQLEKSYGVHEFDDFRLIFVSGELQPMETCYQIQNVYVSDEQFNFVKDSLQQRPGVPAIIFSHAPPIGCGLRTVPRTHVRGTNAYLEQNHDPYRWLKLAKDYPEIIMWFSAHYHLGHNYQDTCTTKYNTVFFNTGVHGEVTRDGLRQSRVIDISKQGISVRTLEHSKRQLISKPDWEYKGPLPEILKERFIDTEEKLLAQANATMNLKHFSCEHSLSVGDETTNLIKTLPLKNERFLVSTNNGYAWEVEPKLSAVRGTVHLGEPLSDIAVSEDLIWLAWDNKLNKRDLNSLTRFVRNATTDVMGDIFHFNSEVDCIVEGYQNNLWLASANNLWLFNGLDSGARIVLTDIFTEGEKPIKLLNYDTQLLIYTNQERLLSWNAQLRSKKLLAESVVNFDLLQKELVTLTRDDQKLILKYQGAVYNWEVELEQVESNDTTFYTTQVLCLGNGRALLAIKGTAFWCHNNNKPQMLQTEAPVETISSVITEDSTISNNYFCITLSKAQESSRPKLQVWHTSI